MKVEVRITVGDKVIADSYREDDEVFRLRRFPSQLIKQANEHCMRQMAEAVEKAITELYTRGTVQEPTSYPPKDTGHPYDVVGDIS